MSPDVNVVVHVVARVALLCALALLALAGPVSAGPVGGDPVCHDLASGPDAVVFLCVDANADCRGTP